MAGILAALQKIDTSVSAAIGTDSQSVLNELERYPGKDSPPFLESTRYPALFGPILQLLYQRMQLGSQIIFYKVRAHRGLVINEIADQQADKGQTSND